MLLEARRLEDFMHAMDVHHWIKPLGSQAIVRATARQFRGRPTGGVSLEVLAFFFSSATSEGGTLSALGCRVQQFNGGKVSLQVLGRSLKIPSVPVDSSDLYLPKDGESLRGGITSLGKQLQIEYSGWAVETYRKRIAARLLLAKEDDGGLEQLPLLPQSPVFMPAYTAMLGELKPTNIIFHGTKQDEHSRVHDTAARRFAGFYAEMFAEMCSFGVPLLLDMKSWDR